MTMIKKEILRITRTGSMGLWVAMLWCGLSLTSCSESSENTETLVEPENPKPVLVPRITETVRYDSNKMTAYNFEYPSTDPFGNEVMLSGAITVGDEVTKDTKARGWIIYNHFTVYQADQVPSRGDLDVQKIIAGSGLITVSADYYGFGATEKQMQAYCLSKQNAKASVDALINARRLLKDMGYKWDDAIFNIGYSEGGQTAMGVVRHISENCPDLKLTYTIAGGGSYDIPETYRQMIASDVTGMPSTVISVLLAYNEYYKLGFSRDLIFKEPVKSMIDEWILSKKYTGGQIDSHIGGQTISSFATNEVTDMTSTTSKTLLAALDDDNLCKGWKPRKDERILLVHHQKDITVPVENITNLYKFLKEENGLENVDLFSLDWGSIGGRPAHESAAIPFAILAVQKICTTLDIKLWIDISKLDF
jgi:hypothetical protein